MKREIFIFIFGLGVVFLNWPFMSIFREAPWKYVFVVWGLLILLNFLGSQVLNRERH
jgi:hypothetical protein